MLDEKILISIISCFSLYISKKYRMSQNTAVHKNVFIHIPQREKESELALSTNEICKCRKTAPFTNHIFSISKVALKSIYSAPQTFADYCYPAAHWNTKRNCLYGYFLLKCYKNAHSPGIIVKNKMMATRRFCSWKGKRFHLTLSGCPKETCMIIFISSGRHYSCGKMGLGHWSMIESPLWAQVPAFMEVAKVTPFFFL